MKRLAQRRRFRLSRFALTMVALPPGVFTAVFLWGGPPAGLALPAPSIVVPFADHESARFAPCAGEFGGTCVVDGDTFWYRGEKIRIADINTPEVSEPECAAEAELGAEATERLTELLNEGPFTLGANPDGRDHDRFGRSLRIITRGGHSIGAVLVDEGIAEEWQGYRRSWC